MGKKARTLSNKAGRLMKCDGQMLKKVIEAKGYKCHELSKMLRYCSDYLTTCCRTNKISDVAAKYLIDYKIFPQMYDLEGEIKVDDIVSPTEVKIDKDEKKIEFGTPYGIVCSEKDLRKYIRQALTKGPHWGTDLMTIRDILDKARANGLSYDIGDMRGDMLFYACKVDGDSEKWMHFVNNLNLKYDPTDQEIKVDEPKEVKIDEDRKKYARAGKEAAEALNKRMDWLNRNAIYGIPKPDKDVELETGLWAIHSEKDLRDCIKRAISPNGPMSGSCLKLMDVSQLLKRARAYKVSYDVEDMRNDLLVYASNISDHPEAWVEFVDHLCLSYHYRVSPNAQEIKKVLNAKYGRPENGVEGINYGYGPAPKNPSYVNASQKIAEDERLYRLGKSLFQLMQATMNDLKHDPEFKELIKQAVKEAYEEL